MSSTNDMESGTFDPLETRASEAADVAVKRRLENIVSSYKNSVDVLAEPVQNAMDAIVRGHENHDLYDGLTEDENTEDGIRPKLEVTIDTDDNIISILDNGRGFPLDDIKSFIAPEGTDKTNWFLDGKVRGHKGVGLTFLAYGFNFFEVTAKLPGERPHQVTLEGGRNWVEAELSSDSDRPEATWEYLPEDGFPYDHGTRVTIQTDEISQPSILSYAFNTAEMTKTILETQTAIGVVPPSDQTHPPVDGYLEYVEDGEVATDDEGDQLTLEDSYRFPHMKLNQDLEDGQPTFDTIDIGEYNYIDDDGDRLVRPEDRNRYHGVYQWYNADEIADRITSDHTGEVLQTTDDVKEYIRDHDLNVYVYYTYSNEMIDHIKERWGIRGNRKYHSPGVRIATDGMISTWHRPADLSYSAPRARRLWFVYHFKRVKPDTGRKDFPPEVHDVLEGTEQFLHRTTVEEGKYFLRPTPRSSRQEPEKPPLQRALEMEDLPTEDVGQYGQVRHQNAPTEEQDVVALFNQISGTGALDCYEIHFFSGIRAFDAFLMYDADRAPAELSGVLPGSSDVSSHDRMINTEFKLTGVDIIKHIINQTRNWEDLNLLVCWELGGDEPDESSDADATYSYGGDTITFRRPTSQEERKYAGVTHLATLDSKGDLVLPTISLKDFLDQINS